MSFKMVDRCCKTCGHTEEYLVRVNDPADQDNWPCSEVECPGTMKRLLAAPHIRTSETASRIDGLPRAGWDDLRLTQAADLAKMDARPAEANYIDKQLSVKKIGEPG